MKRVVVALLGMLLSFAVAAENRPLLVVSEVIQIKAEPAKVWSMVKRFNGLKDWHPLFSGSDIVSGRDGELGAKPKFCPNPKPCRWVWYGSNPEPQERRHAATRRSTLWSPYATGPIRSGKPSRSPERARCRCCAIQQRAGAERHHHTDQACD